MLRAPPDANLVFRKEKNISTDICRVFHQLADLGWVDFDLVHLADSAWADGILPELAEQLGRMVENPKS